MESDFEPPRRRSVHQLQLDNRQRMAVDFIETPGLANDAAGAPQGTLALQAQTQGTPLIDPTDWFDTPKSIVLGVMRTLWWLAWDFCIQTVGWSVGWCVLRVLTLGHYPGERLGGVDEAGAGTAILVEVVGLVVLAAGIRVLARALP